MTNTFCASSPLRFASPPARGGHWRGWLILALSVGAHALLLGHISFSLPSHKPASAPVMSARLMAPVEVIPPTPAPVKTTPDVSPSDQTVQAPASRHEPRNAEKDDPPTQAAPKPVRTEPVSDSQRAATDIPKNSDAALITPSIDTRQALDSYMSSHRQRALLQDSADAATAFQQSKRTVVISDPRKGAQQDPQTATPAPIRVNCASELNATLALLSGLAGGTLRCSELGDIAPHIEKRIKAHSTK